MVYLGAQPVQLQGAIEGYGQPKKAVWGEISGDINDQTDLQNELDLKADQASVNEQILGCAKKADLALKADLSSVPAPANNATITFYQGDQNKGSFTLNQPNNYSIHLDQGGSEGVWGSITGQLSDQVDLQQSLDSKAGINDIPVVNDPTITIKQGTTTKGSFTLNQSGNATITLDAGGSQTQYVNGGWIAKNQNVATNVTVPQGTSSYSLSSYLPADGYKYEVMGLCRYGSTTTVRRSVYGDGCQSVNVNRDETGATNIRFNIVVGANRLIYVGSASGSIFNTYIELGAYRRLEQY